MNKKTPALVQRYSHIKLDKVTVSLTSTMSHFPVSDPHQRYTEIQVLNESS